MIRGSLILLTPILVFLYFVGRMREVLEGIFGPNLFVFVEGVFLCLLGIRSIQLCNSSWVQYFSPALKFLWCAWVLFLELRAITD